MHGEFGIYLNYVNGNHYQAVFRVPQQMPPLHVLQPMPTVSSTPIVIPNLLSQYIRTVAISTNVNAMSPSKLATGSSSTSVCSLQNRPRGRPPKNSRIFMHIFVIIFLTLFILNSYTCMFYSLFFFYSKFAYGCFIFQRHCNVSI